MADTNYAAISEFCLLLWDKIYQKVKSQQSPLTLADDTGDCQLSLEQSMNKTVSSHSDTCKHCALALILKEVVASFEAGKERGVMVLIQPPSM